MSKEMISYCWRNNNMIFSVTGAGSYFTRRSGDIEIIKEQFIEQLKGFFDKHFKQNTAVDPYLYFAKVCLDNNGNVFAIVCTPDPMKSIPRNERLKVGTHFDLTALTITATGQSLYPLCALKGSMDAFYTEDNIKYENTLSHVLRPEKICHLGSLLTAKSKHFENHGIGREMILFWQELCYDHSGLSRLALEAINVKKNVPWYHKFGFKLDEFNVEDVIQKEDLQNQHINEKELYDFIVDKLTDSQELIHLSMNIDDIYSYATNKARKRSEDILNAADEETKNFVVRANNELNEHIKKLRNGLDNLDLSVRRGQLIPVDTKKLPFNSTTPHKKKR